MHWNDDSKSLSRSSLGDGRILPKINKSVPRKRPPGAHLTSNTSMMGVLGVVPEENDSELEEGVIKFTSYSQLNAPVTTKISKATKKCTKKLVEKSKFNMASAIVQTIYVIVALVYLFMIIDVYDDNIFAITSILLVLTLIIFTFYTLILVGRGWKVKLVVEVVFQIMVIIIELADLSFRAQSSFDNDKNSQGNKAINGVATILRVFMVHRRWNEVYTYCLNEILKQVYILTDSDEKTSKELLEHVVKKLPDEYDYYKLILQKVILDTAITVKTPPRLSRINQLRKLSMNSGNVSTIQKDYRLEMDADIDKNIYDVVPDDEEIEQIFKWSEVGEDVRFALILSGIEKLDFNIFELKTISGGNELVLIANHLMEINDFYGKLNIIKDRFRKYSMVIQKLYNPVSYHNKTHAADVAQTSYYFLTSCDFYNIGQVSDMEAAVLLISSMVHDTDHPGVNNLYLVATRDKLALRYNDKSVLENHHIAVAFNTMLKSKETCI
jgi:hypothetical protein